jgi:hypothetical protein
MIRQTAFRIWIKQGAAEHDRSITVRNTSIHQRFDGTAARVVTHLAA